MVNKSAKLVSCTTFLLGGLLVYVVPGILDKIQDGGFGGDKLLRAQQPVFIKHKDTGGNVTGMSRNLPQSAIDTKNMNDKPPVPVKVKPHDGHQRSTVEHEATKQPQKVPPQNLPRSHNGQQGSTVETKQPQNLPRSQDGQQRSTVEHEATKPPQNLPRSVIDGVKTFIFFIGHPCSGHSIVGSLIDSHPHMVVSHEFTLFEKLATKALKPTKSEIFNALWNEDRTAIIKGGTRVRNRKGYTLFVDGLYQGDYVDYIDAIGDKRGDRTIELFMSSPGNWSNIYNNVLKSLNVTLKVIHVIRNPYDNIATLAYFIQTSATHSFGKVKQFNRTRTFTSKHITNRINFYFNHHRGIADAKRIYNLDVIEIHGRDLISDPKGTLLKLCNHLRVTCTDDYLEICSKKIFKKESKTRYLVKWTKEELDLIQENIGKYRCLEGYNFNSA